MRLRPGVRVEKCRATRDFPIVEFSRLMGPRARGRGASRYEGRACDLSGDQFYLPFEA